MLTHPAVFRPADHAEWRPDKMGKSTIYQSARLLVGLNAFEPGQSHALHAHVGMEKMYYVLGGEGIFLLEGRELPMQAGDLLVAPDGVAHGVKNTGKGRSRARSSAMNVAGTVRAFASEAFSSTKPIFDMHRARRWRVPVRAGVRPEVSLGRKYTYRRGGQGPVPAAGRR